VARRGDTEYGSVVGLAVSACETVFVRVLDGTSALNSTQFTGEVTTVAQVFTDEESSMLWPILTDMPTAFVATGC
jgi:hypothetical protein